METHVTQETLIKLKFQKIKRIQQLQTLIEKEQIDLNTINNNICKKCTKHKWIDDGTFDIQNYRNHWICEICGKQKE